MCSGRSTRALPRVGFPIRKSRGQRLVSTSPRLIAASHVLHRLLVPRHPPCALSSLATKMLASTVQFSNNKQPPPPTHTCKHPTTVPTVCGAVRLVTQKKQPRPPTKTPSR